MALSRHVGTKPRSSVKTSVLNRSAKSPALTIFFILQKFSAFTQCIFIITRHHYLPPISLVPPSPSPSQLYVQLVLTIWAHTHIHTRSYFFWSVMLPNIFSSSDSYIVNMYAYLYAMFKLILHSEAKYHSCVCELCMCTQFVNILLEISAWNVPHRVWFEVLLPQLGVLFWEAVESLGGGAWLTKVGHERRASAGEGRPQLHRPLCVLIYCDGGGSARPSEPQWTEIMSQGW